MANRDPGSPGAENGDGACPTLPAPVRVTPPGRDPAAWDACLRRLPPTTVADLQRRLSVPATATLLVVAAHPDDETIGAGRLVRAWTAGRGTARTLVLTDGEACFDGVLPMSHTDVGRWRIAEWEEATTTLGFSARSRSGFPDGGLWREPERLEDAIREAARQVSGPLVLAAPMSEAPHPDHAAAGVAAHRAARALDVGVCWYPIWLAYWSDATTIGGVAASLSAVSCSSTDEAGWRSALDSYASQLRTLAPLPGPVVPADLLTRYPCQIVSMPDRAATPTDAARASR